MPVRSLPAHREAGRGTGWASRAYSGGKAMQKNALFVSFVLALLMAMSVAGCGGGGNGDGNIGDFFDGDLGGSNGEDTGPSLEVRDPNDQTTTTVNIDEPLTVSVENVGADVHYRLRVTGPNGELLHPGDGFLIVTDEDGDALSHTVVQHLDMDQSSMSQTAVRAAQTGDQGVGAFAVGDHLLELVNDGGEVVLERGFTVTDNPYVFCADSSGTAEASFTSAESVHAQVTQAGGTIEDGTYDVHLISDLNPVLFNGAGLPAAQGTVSVSDGSGIVDLGTFDDGAWDVVVDIDGDDRFTAGTDLLSRARRLHPCFVVQDASGSTSITGQIAADAGGNYRDVFDPLAASADVRDVFAYMTPEQQSQVTERLAVDHYVVDHQDTWSDGDTLSDVTTAVESSPVQSNALTTAPWRVWPRSALTSGCYDAVIDANRNGTYDAGTDFVDNIDNAGATSCGLRVANPSCTDNITITSHQDGDQFQSTAITLAGTVSASGTTSEMPDSGQVTITSGRESTTVNLGSASSGDFSADLPLFAGANQLTVSFLYPDETTCAKTITLTNGSAASANVKFRAQLLWDGDTDMDLHLVRPGGTYWNSTDDCYYANCKVGLDGSGSNSVDWGEAGEEDDPKLDVDCIACGNGVENTWLNEIPQDGTYTVYVDAFSGSETDVRVGIFIGSSQVATVNCGSMSSGSNTDTCRVGTITWSGGDDGTGSFTADGSKGSESTYQSAPGQLLLKPLKGDVYERR
ncbi:hypothetical protein H0Z60_01990 [Ectothiorhodospiraceae bacterium WFHF3C12]|nr:hypothetical protein [Ectothiorhodospiraceae bacterium WFHF3C12]